MATKSSGRNLAVTIDEAQRSPIRSLGNDLLLHLVSTIDNNDDKICLALTCRHFYKHIIDLYHIRRLREIHFLGGTLPPPNHIRDIIPRLRGFFPEKYIMCTHYGKFLHKEVLMQALRVRDMDILAHVVAQTMKGVDCPCKVFYIASGCHSYPIFMHAILNALRRQMDDEFTE